jgi:RNA polymerase-binding transcription factor DksA
MTREQLAKYRDRLRELAARIQSTTDSLEENTRRATGGEAGGNLSNAPLHLGDIGTEVYQQELNATLLANENHIGEEIVHALQRIDQGTFGRCENCGQAIPAGRLEALPYTRYCAPCSQALEEGETLNLNEGRPGTWVEGIAPLDDGAESHQSTPDQEPRPFTDLEPEVHEESDRHAAGTPGGGTAVGGLAGTNIGGGDPVNADLESMMGSGVEADREDDRNPEAYAGPSGGAVGGTPAGKRAVGGKVGHGLAPQPGPGESPTGQ